MTKDSNNKRKVVIILSIILAVLVVVGGIFVTIVVTNMSSPPSPDLGDGGEDLPEVPAVLPTLTVPESVSIDKFETAFFTYTIENIGDYVISVEIEDTTIASISNLTITPKNVGTTRIITSINTEPKIEKYTTLEIKDVVTDISYEICNLDNSSATNFYVGNEYLLIVTENAKVNNTPTIKYDDTYIENISLLQKQENILTYKFKIKSVGEFNFEYISKYCSKSTGNIVAYVYPDNFDVEISGIAPINGVINLYLFNNEYKDIANSDNYFNSFSYNITTIPNSNDNVNVYASDNSITVENGVVTANNSGTCTLTFESSVSKVKKEYIINVQEIALKSINFNDEECSLNSNKSLTYEKNIAQNFKISIEPIYAYGSLAIIKNDNVSISNDKISINSEDIQNIAVNFNNSQIFSIQYSLKPKHQISASVAYCSTNYAFNNNNLSIEYEKDAEVYLLIKLLDENGALITSQPLYFEILNENIAKSTNNSNKVTNNYAKLFILSTGTTTIKLYNQDQSITLSIIVSVYTKK